MICLLSGLYDYLKPLAKYIEAWTNWLIFVDKHFIFIFIGKDIYHCSPKFVLQYSVSKPPLLKFKDIENADMHFGRYNRHQQMLRCKECHNYGIKGLFMNIFPQGKFYGSGFDKIGTYAMETISRNKSSKIVCYKNIISASNQMRNSCWIFSAELHKNYWCL